MGNPRRDPKSLAQAEGGPPLVNSVVRAFSILRCFEHGRGNPDGRYLGNQDIARRTKLPKATVSRLTQTLAALGYLEYAPSREKYALGPAVLGLGHAYMAGHDVIDIAQPLMQELADYTQAAVMLAVPEGLRMLLLEVCQGDAMFNLRLEKGARVPHGTTALGRADLAARPREVFEQRLAELERTVPPEAWPKIRAGIERARKDYETYGFVFSLGDWNPDVFAVGVPMVSADGTRHFAFNISGRVSVMTREKLVQDFGPRLVALRNRVYEATEGRF
ncbi:IclR family transcriptional regulator [Luteimonas wenzhouensis]|uniref:IclR family transcriptional regulator n=1 Tax=Luteimonas wenzhouensis TaxID=2599615 RepID=A0A5C5U891_9GAMM|nr:IclR family transcriptional regulator [Luteimonas wenzhouensis]NLW96430.1 IclR family transcriptional regulator [Xanthomonadaceae bacterium]TWT22168.1 IclR family transcriptional regulator [Luteimonas wenzhouensis]